MTSIAFFTLGSYEVHLSKEEPFALSTEETIQFPQPIVENPPAQAMDVGQEVAPADHSFIDWATGDGSLWVWVGNYELLVSKINFFDSEV